MALSPLPVICRFFCVHASDVVAVTTIIGAAAGFVKLFIDDVHLVINVIILFSLYIKELFFSMRSIPSLIRIFSYKTNISSDVT